MRVSYKPLMPQQLFFHMFFSHLYHFIKKEPAEYYDYSISISPYSGSFGLFKHSDKYDYKISFIPLFDNGRLMCMYVNFSNTTF